MNRTTKNASSRLNTPTQAAEKLLVGMNKFYNLINSGKLKAVKMGTGTFVTNEAIDEYIDNLPAYPVEPALRKCNLPKRKAAAA